MKKICIISLLGTGLFLTIPVEAGFLEAGVDETTSMGKFRITFTKEAASTYGIEQFESPVLMDTQTKIGRSTPHLNGDSIDKLTGAFICQEGYINACLDFFGVKVVDYDFPRVPLIDGENFEDGPVGTEEIHIQILTLQEVDMGKCGVQSANAMRAGNAAVDVPPSFGEMESLHSPGSTEGFPAEGFFNLFVEVDVDWNHDGIVDKTLFNKPEEPLMIQVKPLEIFPPTPFFLQSEVVIPIYDKTEALGKSIGWLELIGQGLDSKCEGERSLEEIHSSVASLMAFTATDLADKVLLAWEVASNKSSAGFHLWRAQKDEAKNFIDILKLTDQEILFTGDRRYFYEDSRELTTTTYYYGVEEITVEGISTLHLDSIVSVQHEGGGEDK